MIMSDVNSVGPGQVVSLIRSYNAYVILERRRSRLSRILGRGGGCTKTTMYQ